MADLDDAGGTGQESWEALPVGEGDRHEDRPDAQPSTETERRRARVSRDPRLEQALDILALRLDLGEPYAEEEERRIVVSCRRLLQEGRRALERRRGDTEQGWAWLHAARREQLPLRDETDLSLLEIDIAHEVDSKLRDWRRSAVDAYGMPDDQTSKHRRAARLARVQQHLDESAENDNRKRLLQRRQVLVYLLVMVVLLAVICALEFSDRGLISADRPIGGWWIVAAVLYGSLGGAFSAAQRVAAAGPAVRYPGLRWAQVGNVLRPFAGGVGGLIAFAAVEAGVFGDSAEAGPRCALIAFAAGFSERFIPSLVQSAQVTGSS